MASGRLDPPADSRPEHALGAVGADIVLVEYGSFNCPSCRAAHEVIANLRDRFGERLRYVFRHRPLTGADLTRRASEFAGYAHDATGRYWQAHDAMMKNGPVFAAADLDDIAEQLGVPPRNEEATRRERGRSVR